ncbi:class I SAM-dependent methyltransferase [Gorillibacterium timonense]|uniref:class I SAM-dependent methyltransferase n=1 Tax=Gorillibacterium timonense TaxID=1689269 RepID=UPI00071E55A5|nr:SAM-dependent methyltransferase [Gorillibacterium timonense]
MNETRQLIDRLIETKALTQAVLSNPRRKEEGSATKVRMKPVELKGGLHYQLTCTVGTKELHENLLPDAAADKLGTLIEADYRQGLLQAEDGDYQILVSKKGKASILKKKPTKPQANLAHNRSKSYLLKEGEPVPYLVELGVMNAEGKVLAAKYDKFRQINRFLEMVEDVFPLLPAGKKLRIIDFGCGKSYLTFALYHYLVFLENREVEITGLDLKEDVIASCRALAERLKYEGLEFLKGDIAEYEGAHEADMVVTLHACDTATDAALEKAVRWNARVILSVPCCQHELYSQLEQPVLEPMLEHGIIRERFAALATDSARARLLELVGYKTQILEFIDMEHTPKNLLIRAVKQASPDSGNLGKLAANYLEFKRFLHIDPYLERALADQLAPLFRSAPGE